MGSQRTRTLSTTTMIHTHTSLNATLGVPRTAPSRCQASHSGCLCSGASTVPRSRCAVRRPGGNGQQTPQTATLQTQMASPPEVSPFSGSGGSSGRGQVSGDS